MTGGESVTIKVGFDYDEPIFKWYDNAHTVSVREGLAKPEDPPPTTWDPTTTYKCTPEQWYDVLNAEVRKGRDGMYFWPVDPGAKEQVRRLYRAGYEVHFVTARGSFGEHGEDIKSLTLQQIIHEGLPYDGLHFATNKHDIIKSLGLDYFIDDRPNHYLEAVRAGADTYLLDERWNQDFPVGPKRVKSVTEYVDLIIEKHGNLFEQGKELIAKKRKIFS